jgi:hypothetical protein
LRIQGILTKTKSQKYIIYEKHFTTFILKLLVLNIFCFNLPQNTKNMIPDDRKILNERFRSVFGQLEERGIIKANDREGKGIGDFAEKLLGKRSYGHIIRAFLNPKDKRCIDYHHVKTLCKEFGVNESFMLYGKGSPFGIDLPEDQGQVTKRAGNILFTSTEAFAGTSIGESSFVREENDYFSIPGIGGMQMVAFPIKGNSMEPVIGDGDIVICKPVESLSSIRDNKIYAVKNSGSVWVKYVQRIPGLPHVLKLISANHLEHDPFEEEINEFTRIYEVVRKISTL